MKKGTYPIFSLVKNSHKKFEDPQNDKEFKTPKFENTKTKDLRSFQNKIKYPISPLVKLHTKKLKTGYDKKQIEENRKTKNFQSSHEKKHIPHLLICETSHTKMKTPKMTRKKLKIPKLQNTKTIFFKIHKKKGKYPFSPIAKLHTILF
jgi:hypothetical protein